jgi:WD40 repeat protein
MRLEKDSNSQNQLHIRDIKNNSKISRAIIESVIEAGYMNIDGNSFNPTGTITWSEAGKIVRMLSGVVLNKGGTYSQEALLQLEGNMTICSDKVKLCNKIIKGSLFITSGAGDGTVKLENVKVLGRTIICGGSQVYISKKSGLGSLVIDKKAGESVILSALNDSRTGNITVMSDAFLNEEDVTGLAFGEITINPGVKKGEEVILKGDYTTVTANAPGLIIIIKEGAMIGTINLNESAHIKGFGTIGTINIYAEDCSIEQVPGKMNIKEKSYE